MDCVKDKGKVVHTFDTAPGHEDIFTARGKPPLFTAQEAGWHLQSHRQSEAQNIWTPL